MHKESQRAKNSSTMAASLQAAIACALVLLLAVVPHACTASTSETLQDSCESYAGGDRSGLSYDYCVRTLQRDSKSGTADALGLALIAARMARATAKRTRAKIFALLANETVLARRGCLAACVREYAAAVRRLGHAVSAARAGPWKNVLRARTLLADARDAPELCGAAFEAAGRRDSPLDNGDRVIDDQIGLAISILPSLPPSPPGRT